MAPKKTATATKAPAKKKAVAKPAKSAKPAASVKTQAAPEKKPDQIKPEAKPVVTDPEVQPQEKAPEKKPEEIQTEAKPVVSTPEVQPQENDPEIKPEEVQPEAKPVEGSPEAQPAKLAVVIPYLAGPAKGKELLFALRSWEQNFKEDFVIVLIGDKPEFVSDEVIHIPSVSKAANPQLDVVAKLMQAIAADKVSYEFVLTNDDIYPVAPITLDDLKVLRIAGKLGETKLKANPHYLEKILATLSVLKEEKYPTYDFATHLPVVYQKGSLASVIDHFGADKKGLLLSSLYFNVKIDAKDYPELVLTKGNKNGDHVVYVYRDNPNLEVVQDGFDNRKFVNHNSAGYLPTLPFLEKAFPDKSKFEK